MSGGTQRAFVPTRRGLIHIASNGTGFPVLLLHQTPRSWDEYRDVLPILGRQYRAIAMDTGGFGDSEALADNSIEDWADAAFALLDALGIARAAVVGHHTGAVIALEMAASRPERVAALALSSMSMIDAERRAAHDGQPVVDEVERCADGAHLTVLWRRRQPYYPPGNIELLERLMIDALKAGPLAAEGHRVVNRYCMESRLPLVRSPTLVLAADADPHAYPSARRVADAIPGSVLSVIEGGMLPLPDQLPQRFSAALAAFFDGLIRPGDVSHTAR